jgi:hypothetical protein
MPTIEGITPVLIYQDIPAAHDFRWWFAAQLDTRKRE